MQYPPFRIGGTVGANQSLTLTFSQREATRRRITQVTNEMPGAAGASCTLRLNGTLITPLVASGDAAAGEPYIWTAPGDQLQVVWTGAAVGLVGTMLVISDDGRET